MNTLNNVTSLSETELEEICREVWEEEFPGEEFDESFIEETKKEMKAMKLGWISIRIFPTLSKIWKIVKRENPPVAA